MVLTLDQGNQITQRSNQLRQNFFIDVLGGQTLYKYTKTLEIKKTPLKRVLLKYTNHYKNISLNNLFFLANRMPYFRHPTSLSSLFRLLLLS